MPLSKKAAALIAKAKINKKPNWSDSLPADGRAVLYELADAEIAGTLGRSWSSLYPVFCESYAVAISITSWVAFLRRHRNAKRKGK